MSKKKILLMVLLVLLVVLSVAAGLFWHMRHYVLVELQFYPRGVQQLDLRDQEITIRHFEKLQQRMPGCEIHWRVPFQNAAIANDVKEITLTALDLQDIQYLKYFPDLEQIHAENCEDYAALLELRNKRPDLKVNYTVSLGTEKVSSDAEQVMLKYIEPDQIPLMDYLPNLRTVQCTGGEAEAVSRLKDYCRDRQLEFQVLLGKENIPLDTKKITIDAISREQLGLLQLFPELKQLHLIRPEAPVEKLQEWKKLRPEVTMTWEQEICGQLFASTVEEIDLSGAKITSLEDLDRQLSYFPAVKLVFLGECGLDNELLAAQREQARDRYKLVWTVSCGSKLKTRTDATTFMPVREYVYYFNDEEAYNLRYCEDMICIDIGHMSIHNIDFVEYMPNLQYLILAHTQLQYIDPISTCKKLKFLELDWSPVRDLTPLKGCTALEDLNLGKVYADFTPIGEMTWLKNLWMVECSSADRYKMPQALPNTRVMVTGAATVANGWRDLDNYYAMRDLLGMRYMSW